MLVQKFEQKKSSDEQKKKSFFFLLNYLNNISKEHFTSMPQQKLVIYRDVMIH